MFEQATILPIYALPLVWGWVDMAVMTGHFPGKNTSPPSSKHFDGGGFLVSKHPWIKNTYAA